MDKEKKAWIMQVVTKVIEMPRLGRGDPTVVTGETAGRLEPGGSWGQCPTHRHRNDTTGTGGLSVP